MWALDRQLGVGWHTLWDAVKVEAKQRVADPVRLSGADPGVDEHIWQPSKRGTNRAVTAMVI